MPDFDSSLRRLGAFLAVPALALLAACAPQLASAPPPPPANTAEQRAPVTILVSIDGFRTDYLQRGLTPTLARLAVEGVSASMIPSFPSKTFPNHWTLVTGYYPDHHGIIANAFTDPARPEAKDRFTMAVTDPFFWNEKEPVWATAQKAGIRTAAMFWPGSAVAWGGTLKPRGYGRTEGGTRPADWQAFDQNVSPTQRVNAVIDWLRRPAAIRPQLLFLYFDEVDTAGHDSGPDGRDVPVALANVDRNIAALLEGLAGLGQPANLVVVADHGMAETRGSRTIALDALLSPEDYVLDEAGPYATFRPKPGREAALEASLLRPHPHMECWRKSDIPARLRYGTNPRIPPYLCLAETGWQIFPAMPAEDRTGGNHGYDSAAHEMRSLFIASGPAFRRGATLPDFENVAVAPLLRRLVGLPQDPVMDGKLTPVEGALAN